jgi:N-acetylglutamate synthase-like GNAT family acetyltransferase
MELVVRRASEEDIPVIHEITQEAFEKYANDLGLPHKVAALKETYKNVKSDMDKKNILIASVNGQTAGTIRYETLAESVIYISRFGVRPNLHNCGVGKALIQAVEFEAKKLNTTVLTLHSGSKIASLVQFYYSMGFYIHSISTNRGYIRALFCKELINAACIDLSVVNIK